MAENFIAITQVLMVISQSYYRHFKPHFTNIVDIIVGWHLEQKSKVKVHCSIVLQSFHQCWEADSRFTLDLLSQLLEDIEGCHEKLTEDDDSEIRVKVNEFGSFVGKISNRQLLFSFFITNFFHFQVYTTRSSNASRLHQSFWLISSQSRFWRKVMRRFCTLESWH